MIVKLKPGILKEFGFRVGGDLSESENPITKRDYNCFSELFEEVDA